jgi:hypothetical protein
MKKVSALLMFGLLAIALAAAPAFAGHHDKGDCSKGKCSWSKKDCSKGDCGKGSGGCPLVEKFMKKAHFFLDNQSEIGLTDEQVTKINTLKMDMKKTMIRNMAEHEIFMLDMKSKLSEPALDVEGINAMIDQSMAGMAAGAKGTVAALAELKSVLTEDQMTKAKEIWKKM